MNKLMKTKWVSLLMVATLAGMLSGCAWSIGSDRHGGAGSQETTLGQELIDLKRAKEAGAINDAEYELQRKRLMDKP
jgi:hypothetical protein